MQIDKQIVAANFRLTIAQTDLSVHQQQMQNAQDFLDTLSNKYTNQELYAWMISDISATYFQCYQLAYDLAKKAARAFRFELGLTTSNYIQFGQELRAGYERTRPYREPALHRRSGCRPCSWPGGPRSSSSKSGSFSRRARSSPFQMAGSRGWRGCFARR